LIVWLNEAAASEAAVLSGGGGGAGWVTFGGLYLQMFHFLSVGEFIALSFWLVTPFIGKLNELR